MMNDFRNRIKNAMKECRQEFLSNYKDEAFEECGAVYYMNADDGTVFDWEQNGRLCEFMVFYEESKRGAIKLNVKKDGSAVVYIYSHKGDYLIKEKRIEFCSEDEVLSLAIMLFNAADKEKKYNSNIDEIDFAHEVTAEERKEFLTFFSEEPRDDEGIIPDNVRKRIGELFKSRDDSKKNHRIIIEDMGDNIFYSCIVSKEHGNFEQMLVDGYDLSFLWDGSAMPQKDLLGLFKEGLRSIQSRNKKTRRNVFLPVIDDDKEILNFARKMAEAFINLFEIRDPNEEYPLKGEWYKMIYNSVALLLSAKNDDTKLITLTHLFHSPHLVKFYLSKVMDEGVYDYWTKEVPLFIKRKNSASLINYYDFTIASLIGEQEIQDLCNNYKED